MAEPKGRKVPSRQWSCSELKDGDAALTRVKREPEEDLETKIKERTQIFSNLYGTTFTVKFFFHTLGTPDLQDYEMQLQKMKEMASKVVSWIIACNWVLLSTQLPLRKL